MVIYVPIPKQSDQVPNGHETASLLIQPPTAPSIMDQTEHRGGTNLWSPAFLRPLTLALIGCTYMVAAIVLSIIAWYSSGRNGICEVHPTNHYLWQYTPTAIFTFLSSLWAQVDYRSRSMMPWVLMNQEPQIASRSILLDYVSPNVITALIKSFKAKDIHVALAVLGTVLNKLLIIVSTRLFTLESINNADESMFMRGGRAFSGLGFNASLVSKLPAARVFGIESMNMSYPFGTTQDYATELPPVRGDNSTVDILSQVNIIRAYADCEIAYLQSEPVMAVVDTGMWRYIDSNNNTVVVLAGQGYEITDPHGNTRYLSVLPYMMSPARALSSNVSLFSKSCSSIVAVSDALGPPWPIFDQSPETECSDDDYRFAFGFYDSANRSAFLMCKPGYEAQTAEMTYLYNSSFETGEWRIGDPASIRGFSNLTAQDLFKGFATAIVDFNKTQLLGPLAPDGNADALLDADILKETFSKFYASTTAQIANHYLLTNNDKEFNVTELREQNRLQLRGYGLWFTEAILLLMAVNSIALSYLFRRPITPRDPGSVTGVTAILARSQELMRSLSGSGLRTLEGLRTDFATDTFHAETIIVGSEITGEFCIRRSTTPAAERSTRHLARQREFTWYYPFILSTTGRVCIVATAVMIITALEALYQFSSQNSGFVTFSNRQYDEYAWRFVPATVLVLFGLLVNALEFELKTFQPFFSLKRGSVPGKKSVDENYLGYLGLYGLLIAARKQHFCLMAVIIGTMCTNFLTIISSGLFTAQTAIVEKPVLLHSLDHVSLDAFNDINQINYQVNGMMAATLVLDEGMDLPRWTYDSFVVPVLSLPTQPDHQIDYESLQITAPATRAVANCTELFVSNVSLANNTHEIVVNFESLPPCGTGTNTSTYIDGTNLSGPFAFWNDRSSDVYHCPEYFVVAGNLDEMNSAWKPLVMHCKPYLETVDALIELTYPNLSEVRSFTPLLDASSRKFATTVEIPGIGRNLLVPYTKNPRSGTSQTVGSHYVVDNIKIQLDNGTVDGFFGTIIQQGTSLSTLTADIQNLASAVENMYPRVVSQALNLNRVAKNATALSGTARLRNKLRLTQNGASTRALQALLAVMAVSTAATFTLGSTKHVLPKNPRSIAAVASLLAGSSMLDEKVIPSGSEWRTGKELKRLGLFEDQKFSMGWWSNGSDESGRNGGKSRFGIDIGAAEWYDAHGVNPRATET